MARHTHEGYVIDDDISRVDWPRVHGWLVSSYWSPGITLGQVKRAAANSTLVVGAFTDEEQVGYMRVISDKTRFAYVADVWVGVEHRGRGLGRAMVRRVMEDPEFATVLWLLATRDAHGVYSALGFAPIEEPQRWMIRKRGEAL